MNVISNYQVSGSLASTVGGTGTARKLFPVPLGASIGVQGTTPTSTSAIGQLAVPGFNALNGQDFEVVVVGAVNTDSSIACPTITIDLIANTGTVASPTYTTIATTGGVTGSTLALNDEPFKIIYRASGDTGSGIVGGTYSALYNGALQNSTPKAATTISGINFGNALPFGLCVGVTFSVSGAKNTASLYQFTLSA